ncbi:GNAT family N-acetyltransferase [Saccharopolyspora sp. MS10]|uniref:GNAT family N-acetyltransferase n=1 Tax=Saccharopolyspora sp. MS10 TaxID=3385973 RepID=UPI0039A19723
MRVRAAVEADLAELVEVERRSGRWFRDVGMPEVAADPPMPVVALEVHRRAGSLWVTEAPVGPVAFLAGEELDGGLHLAQLCVDPAWARRRLGAGLIEHAARVTGAAALTLTTFRDVPWNAPYYGRLGFRVLAGPGGRLGGLLAAESARFRAPRVAMRRER